MNYIDIEISPAEVLTAIGILKNNKSPGLDCIRNEMLKCGRSTLVPILAKFFNGILVNGLVYDGKVVKKVSGIVVQGGSKKF